MILLGIIWNYTTQDSLGNIRIRSGIPFLTNVVVFGIKYLIGLG